MLDDLWTTVGRFTYPIKSEESIFMAKNKLTSTKSKDSVTDMITTMMTDAANQITVSVIKSLKSLSKVKGQGKIVRNMT